MERRETVFNSAFNQEKCLGSGHLRSVRSLANTKSGENLPKQVIRRSFADNVS